MRISLDCETRLITDDQPVPDLVCLQIATIDFANIYSRHEAANVVSDILRQSDIEIVGHNIAFDFSVLVRHDPDLIVPIWQAYSSGRILDTMISAQLDDIARGCFEGTRKGAYTLAACVDRYMGAHVDKGEDTWRLRYGELIDIPIDQWPRAAVDYALNDAKVTLQLANTIHESPDARRQTAYAWWLKQVSNYGITTDGPRVQTLLGNAADEAGTIAQTLLAHDLLRWEKSELVRCQANVQKRIVAALGIGAKRTAKGNVQTSEESCTDANDPLLSQYARFSQLSDLLHKDAAYLTRPIVRPGFGLAKSGRSTSFSPNMQNIKKDAGVRECFIPRPGYVFAIADYSGLELCTLAQVCHTVLKQSKLREALLRNEDPHTIVASEILGIPYAEGVKRKHDPSDKGFYMARQTGKVLNFGAPGGLGPATLVMYAKATYDVTLTPFIAKKLKEEIWYKAYPEMRKYFNWINDLDDPLQQLFSGRLRGGCTFCQAANTFFQGLGGDVTKCAGFEIAKACAIGSLKGSHIVNYEHDAYIVEVPIECAHEYTIELTRLMIEAPRMFVPDVPLKTEPLLASRWSKSAIPVFKDGRLIPWIES